MLQVGLKVNTVTATITVKPLTMTILEMQFTYLQVRQLCSVYGIFN